MAGEGMGASGMAPRSRLRTAVTTLESLGSSLCRSCRTNREHLSGQTDVVDQRRGLRNGAQEAVMINGHRSHSDLGRVGLLAIITLALTAGSASAAVSHTKQSTRDVV